MNMDGSISRERALLIGLATAAFGVVTLMRKMALNHISPMQFQIAAAVVHAMLIPAYFICLATGLEHAGEWNRSGILWTIAAILVNALGTVAFMYALQSRNDPGLVSGLIGAAPIVTLMLSALFLGETPSPKSVVGIGLVLVGVFLASR